MILAACSEDDPDETFAASRVISSQILGYDGGEVDTKERVEVTFPVNVRMCWHACSWWQSFAQMESGCM